MGSARRTVNLKRQHSFGGSGRDQGGNCSFLQINYTLVKTLSGRPWSYFFPSIHEDLKVWLERKFEEEGVAISVADCGQQSTWPRWFQFYLYQGCLGCSKKGYLSSIIITSSKGQVE